MPREHLLIAVSYRKIPHKLNKGNFVRITALTDNVFHNLLKGMVVVTLAVDLKLEDLFEEKGKFFCSEIALAVLIEACQYYF